MALIGLSLSFCVRDLALGVVAPEDVAFITSGTRCETAEHWDDVLKTYREVYWYKCPEQADAIARQLIAEGRVRQPKLEHVDPVRWSFDVRATGRDGRVLEAYWTTEAGVALL